MKRNRIFSGSLAAILSVAMLAGCSGSNTQSSSSAAPAATQAAATEAAATAADTTTEAPTEAAASEAAPASADSTGLKGMTIEEDQTYGGETRNADGYFDDNLQKFDDVKLTMLKCWNGGVKTASDQYNTEVAKYIRDKIGVTVTVEGIMMDEGEKLNLMFASGDMPDIIDAPYWGGNSGSTAIIKKAANEGQLLPLEDYITKYPNLHRAFDLGVIAESYWNQDLAPENFDGHVYVLPTQTPGTVNDVTNWGYGVFVRGDVPTALGIDPQSIKTTDQLYDFMQKAQAHNFKDVNGNDCIIATTYHNGWNYGGYSEGLGPQKLSGYSKTADGKVTLDALTDWWVNQQMFIWKLVKNNLLDKECFKQTDSQADEKVGNGTALFYAAQMGSGINSTKLTGLYNAHPEMRYVPVGPMNDMDGNPLVAVQSNGRAGSPALFFPTTCSNLEAALTYVDYINTKEGALVSYYGIEGETYQMNDQGQPRLTKDLLDRKAAGDSSWEDDLRAVGAHGYIADSMLYGNMKMEWFGEASEGDADAAVPDIEAYKKLRPNKIFDGYPISAYQNQSPDWDSVSTNEMDSNTQNDYCQRAFFADTEDEARQILTDYQNKIMTDNNGELMTFLDFLTSKLNDRDDIVF